MKEDDPGLCARLLDEGAKGCGVAVKRPRRGIVRNNTWGVATGSDLALCRDRRTARPLTITDPKTIAALKNFLPVPAAGLTAEFAAGPRPRRSARGPSGAARRRRAEFLCLESAHRTRERNGEDHGTRRRAGSHVGSVGSVGFDFTAQKELRRSFKDVLVSPTFLRRQTPRSVDASRAGVHSDAMAFDGERFRIANSPPP